MQSNSGLIGLLLAVFCNLELKAGSQAFQSHFQFTFADPLRVFTKPLNADEP